MSGARVLAWLVWRAVLWPAWAVVTVAWWARPGPGLIAACWWTAYRHDALIERWARRG